MRVQIDRQYIDYDCMTKYIVLLNEAKIKAIEVVGNLVLSPGDYGSFGVWTNGVPELIFIAEFYCDESGKVNISYDYSCSTV